MEKTTVIKWVAGAVARGITWFLAAKVGMRAAQCDDLGLSIAEALAALVMAGVAIYTSVKGRDKLLKTPPPTPLAHAPRRTS
jgi:hypothetical protein